MGYKVSISPRALKEIENAIDYYSLYSNDAPNNFITALKKAFTNLEKSPFYMLQYKNVRSLKLSQFPYSLYFIVNEVDYTVRVLSCFHNKRPKL